MSLRDRLPFDYFAGGRNLTQGQGRDGMTLVDLLHELYEAAGLLYDPTTLTPVVIYVDGTNGNDEWDGTSETHIRGTTGPKKTWVNAKKEIPFIRHRQYFVKFADGTYKEQFLIDGFGPLYLVGGVQGVKSGTVTALTTTGLEPTGFYQLGVSGFTVADDVDDEYFAEITFADGQIQVSPIYSVLDSSTIEIIPYLFSGKTAGDYAGCSVRLIEPSVILQNPVGVNSSTFFVSSVMAGQYTSYAGGELEDYAGIGFWGIRIKCSSTSSTDYALDVDNFSGTLSFGCFIADGMPNASGVKIDDSDAYLNRRSDISVVGADSYAILLDLTGGRACHGSYGINGFIALGINDSLSLERGTIALLLDGVCKGEIDIHYGTYLAQLGFAGQVRGGAQSIDFHHGYMPNTGGGSVLILAGTVAVERGTIHEFPNLVFRGCTSQPISISQLTNPFRCWKIHYDGSYAGPIITINDCDVELGMSGGVTIESHATGHPVIKATNSKIVMGNFTAPTQDYGNAAAGGGIITLDQDSRLRTTGAATGKNTNGTNSAPLVVRRGSSANLHSTYDLKDGSDASTAIVGTAGSVAVPASGNSVNDALGVGNEELCRISRL